MSIETPTTNYYTRLIESDEFYFEKGKDALKKWLDLILPEEDKIELRHLLDDYTTFAEMKNGHHLFPIKELLFSIISYCDIHARDKVFYNQYKDKRVLAKAGVRMKPWIINTFNYKYNKSEVNITVKNALDMLIAPESNINSIALSHRELISNYYLNHPYNPNTFVRELKEKFSYLDKAKNPENQTLLIAAHIYNDKNDWDKKQMNFRTFINNLKEYVQENQLDYEFGDFKGKQQYIWVFDKDHYFNSLFAHYEVIIKKGLISVDLHFEKGNKNAEIMRTLLGELPPFLEWKKWSFGNSVSHINKFKISDKDLVENIINCLHQLFDSTSEKLIDTLKMINSELNMDNTNIQSLNRILYGPPGTGKTYQLQKLIKKWELDEKTEYKKDYTQFVKNITWWQIISLALLDLEKAKVPDLAKHPLIIAKLGSSNIKSLKTRLWSSLQHHCVDHCENVKLAKRIGEKVFYKEADDSIWRLDDPDTFRIEYLALIDSYDEFKSSDTSKSKDYTFTTCHQSLSYEDFIEGIKPDLDRETADNDEEKSSNILYQIRKGIFYNACEKAVQKAGFINLQDCLDRSKEERKELFEIALLKKNIHVIFLDEINRCNVSSVFGELITLIENDKRLGKENEITDITLPYSQDEFGVPANLLIIGTMNTADRSIEALDTALRRRFCFEEMLPDLEVLNNKKIDNIELKTLLSVINKRIEILLDRDHTIGHSYFINITNSEDLRHTFKNNIIPLLQEYFYGDYEKIGMILGTGFFDDVEKYDNRLFANFPTQNYPEGGSFLRLKTINENFNIIGAIETLLGNN